MKPNETPVPVTPWHARIRQVGTIILIAGLFSAAAIYLLAGDSTGADGASRFVDARQYDFQVRRLGGSAGLLIVRFNAWVESLWHGTRLAYTVAVLSVVIGLACHRLATLMATELPPDHGTRD